MRAIRYIGILIFLPLCLFAQRREQSWEIPFFVGASNYIGDLAPDMVFSETRAAVGAGIKRNFNNYLSVGLHFTYGSIAGDDKNVPYLATRGLNFQSPIFELSPQAEFNFFRFGGYRGFRFTPYLYTGVALFYFNPTTKYKDKTYYLQTMHTEGQGIDPGAPKPYSLYNFAVLFGAGFKYKLNDSWVLALHGAYRSTFTDYLDDVGGNYPNLNNLSPVSAALSDRSGDTQVNVPGRQRGTKDTKDWYVFAGFTLSYIIRHSPCYTF